MSMSMLKLSNAQRRLQLNPNRCVCENGKYLGGIIDDSVIRSDKIINAVGNV